MSQPDQPQPDPGQPQPGQPQPGQPQPGQPDPGQPQPGQPQPGQPEPAPWGLPPAPVPAWQPQGWSPTPPGGPPVWPTAQPGGLPPYGWAARTRFDPADPLISDDYNGWWRRSTAVIRRAWKPLAAVQLLVAVPTLALQIPSQIYSERQQRETTAALGDQATAPDVTALFAPLLTIFAVAIVVGFIYALGTLASMRLVAVVANGGNPRIGDALGAALRRVPAMAGWYVLAMLFALVAMLACFLPVFYVGAALTVLPAVVMFERGGAIPRCFRLFHADLGAAIARVATLFGLALVSSVVFGVLSVVVALALQGVAVFDTSAKVSNGSIVAVGTVTAVLNALYAVALAVVGIPLTVATYADLRARYEPFTSAALVDGPPSGPAGWNHPQGARP